MPDLPRRTPPRPGSPLSDLEFHALLPRSPRGRQIGDLRLRMDAIFFIATSAEPWHALPERFGKPDTASRYFRRLTHAGLWQKLLEALTDLAPAHPLRAIEAFICRACRRAHRILGLRSALNGPPWLLPNPILSETIIRFGLPDPPPDRRGRRDYIGLLKTLRHLLRVAGGRRSLPRSVRLAWVWQPHLTPTRIGPKTWPPCTRSSMPSSPPVSSRSSGPAPARTPQPPSPG